MKATKKLEKEAEALSKKRFDETMPVVKKIVRIIFDSDLPLRKIHARENIKFDAVAKECMTVMLDSGMRYVDKDFLFQLVTKEYGGMIDNKFKGTVEYLSGKHKGDKLTITKEMLFSMTSQPFEIIREIVFVSLAKNLDVLTDRMYEKPFGDVTLQDIDKRLKSYRK